MKGIKKFNKKAMHFYNTIELLFLVLLVILAIGSIFILMKSNNNYTPNMMSSYRNDFIYEQELMNFAHSSIIIDDKEMTVPESINELMRISMENNPSSEEIELRTKIHYALRTLAESTLAKLDDDVFFALDAELYKNDRLTLTNPIYTKYGGFGVHRSIPIPCYLGKSKSQGDYKIKLVIRSRI